MHSIERKGWSAGVLLVGLTLGCNGALGIDSAPTRPDEPPLAPGECRTHNDCLKLSGEVEPEVCVNERCVPLRTDSCPLPLPQTGKGWLGALRSSGPQALIVGAFLPLNPPFDLFAHDFDLALTELANTTGGVPMAGGGTRPVIALACYNQYSTPEAFDAAADHLIEELQVPAILPGLYTDDLQHLFEHSAHSEHVFLLSPFVKDDSLVVGYPDDGLIWGILPPPEDVAPAYVPLLARSLDHLVATGALGKNELARVALVRTDDVRETNELASAVAELLGIAPGGAGADPSAEFETFSISSLTTEDPNHDYSDVVLELAAFQPHVVIAVGGDELTKRLIPALEASSDSPPFYVLSPYHYLMEATSSLVRDHPELVERIAGVNFSAAEDQSVNHAYQARFRSAYAGSNLLAEGHENLYDAMYYLLYSAAAAGDASLGSDLVEGMRHLLKGGETFEVGPDDLRAAFAVLATPGNSITLNGAMGPPSFSPDTGVRHMPGSVWCVDEHGNFHADVLRLDGTELVGSFPCFEFGDR